tara:strand:+ start:302 stop:994 length:693 start_codon:yes stop_codon:yes gene_type:complete
MNSKKAIEIIHKNIGIDLRTLAKDYSIDIIGPKGGLKKGWAGDVVETLILGKKDNSPNPDLSDCELKIVPLIIKKNNKISVKEPMSICMANENEILNNKFEESHVYEKLKKQLIVMYLARNMSTDPVIIVGTRMFNINDRLFSIVKNDYLLLQAFIKKNGLNKVSGSLGRPCNFFSMRPKDAKGKSSGNIFPRRAFTIRNKDVFNYFLNFKESELNQLNSLCQSLSENFN